MMKKSLLLLGALCCGGGVVLASTADNVEQDVVTNRKRALLQRLAELENALSEFLPTGGQWWF